MSATATPYGFRPVNLQGGRVYAGAFRQIPIASAYGTAIYMGDPVKLVSGGTVEKDTGTTALTPVGVFVGVAYTSATLGYWQQDQYWPAGTVAADAMAYVVDDPFAIFQIQANGSLAATALGLNAAIVQTAGNAQMKLSRITLNSASEATTDTLPLRIVDFVRGGGSTPGDAYTDVLVQWNWGMHLYQRALGV
jgi:hypothetical protein